MKKKIRKKLQEKATRITHEINSDNWKLSLPAIIQREIALTIHQIETHQNRHKQHCRELLRQECKLGTDLKQLHRHKWSLPQQERIKKQLFELEKERREQKTKLEEKLLPLEEKLLDLIHKHDQINISE